VGFVYWLLEFSLKRFVFGGFLAFFHVDLVWTESVWWKFCLGFLCQCLDLLNFLKIISRNLRTSKQNDFYIKTRFLVFKKIISYSNLARISFLCN
jgi:hypothetical protein